MRLSHSKLNCLLNNPMEYYISYILGIEPKTTKEAFDIGGAVHWGIEHNTEDVSSQLKNCSIDNIILSHAMVHGYNTYKDKIFNELLHKDETDDNEILDEIHELEIVAPLKSYVFSSPHEFVGIIDLLLYTKKGFIIIDYKTSSTIPDWNNYLDQLYRYIFLLKSEFPDVPILKIGIINLRKSKIKRLKDENDESYLNRMRKEYEINDNNLINWHIFPVELINQQTVDNYIDNLSHMADTAGVIDLNKVWYINFDKINDYGGSPYKEIYLKTQDSYVLYNIRDKIYDKNLNKLLKKRSCKQLDIDAIYDNKILNNYEQFKAQAIALFSVNKNIDKDNIFKYIKSNFKTDDDLLEQYWITLEHEVLEENKKSYV